MMDSVELAQRRKARAIARRYERDGYRVTIPARGEALPGFPEGFAPDLIAESDTDRVVVQIKQSRAVRGANDIEALAEHVAGRPGWRFELVTIKVREASPWPVSGRFALIADRARQAIGLGLDDVGYVYAVQGLEMLLKETALRNGTRDGAPAGISGGPSSWSFWDCSGRTTSTRSGPRRQSAIDCWPKPTRPTCRSQASTSY